MQRLKLVLSTSIVAGVLTLTGCFPGVYKIDVQQGNIVTQDMVNQLRPGMTKVQVKYLMGSPLLVDPFHANRWDYLYSRQPGGGTLYQENVVLVFDRSEQLVGLAGDFLPGVSRDEEILGGRSQQQQSGTERDTSTGGLEESIQRDVDSVQQIPIDTPDTIN